MASQMVPTDRADQIFRLGPEDLIAQSPTIVSGPVSGYATEVQKYSQPDGGVPLQWIARGQVDRPVSLKGTPPAAPIRFSRAERSNFDRSSPTAPLWEGDFGNLSPDGQAVLFFGAGSDPKALPGGSGQQDLAALVRDIVRIQSIADPVQQRRAWLQYLVTADMEEGREAALRSLVRAGAGWDEIVPSLNTLFSQPGAGSDIRTFAFAFVAFHVKEETWGKHANAAVDFLCRTLAAAKDARQQIRHLQGIKLVLRYTVEEPRQESRQPLRESIMKCLDTWASHGFSDPALQQEYDGIRAQYR